MTHRLLLVFIILLYRVACYGGDVTTLSGVVIDKSGAGLPGASVRAFCSDSVIYVITDVSGLYNMELPRLDSISVCVSFEGFKPQNFIIIGSKEHIEKNIVLQEDAIALQEVVVQGSNVIHKNDKSIYFPAKNQRKGTNTGLGLLYNMMIPELRVDKRNGNVVTSDNKNVTQCINGVPASLTEIKNIRPKDIIRIDFYTVPTGKFARYDAVIDYVVRHNNYGGYIDIKTSTTVINAAGDYDVTLRYSHGKWVQNLMGGFDFAYNKKNRNEADELVALSPQFERHSLTDKYKRADNNQYLHWGLTKTTENLQLSFKTGMMGNSTPHSDSENFVYYEPEVYSSSKSVILSDSKGIGTYINGYVQWTINKNQYLTFNASYQYGHSGYNRQMSEDTYSSAISTRENSHKFSMGMCYSLNVAKRGNLTFHLFDNGDIFKDRYEGDVVGNQKLVNNTITVSLYYKFAFSKRLNVQSDLSLQHVISKVDDTKENTWLFLPTLYVSYKTSERGRIVLNAKSGSVSPPIEWKSDIYQNVNAYEQIKGNKDLYHIPAYLPSVSYSYSLKKMTMNFVVNSFLAKHSVQDKYYLENSKLVHTYCLGKSFCAFSFVYKLTSYLLNNNLQLSGGVGYDVAKTNDEMREKWRNIRYSIDLMYSCGDFVLSGSYNSKSKGLNFTGSGNFDEPYYYSLSVSYSRGHWYASLSFNNFFSSKPFRTEYMNSSVYKSTVMVRSWEYSPSIMLKLSYNVDFGKKKVEHDDVVPEKNISTGYLCPKE